MRVVFAGFPNLSVCRLPKEIWVCLRAKRNENGGSNRSELSRFEHQNTGSLPSRELVSTRIVVENRNNDISSIHFSTNDIAIRKKGLILFVFLSYFTIFALYFEK